MGIFKSIWFWFAVVGLLIVSIVGLSIICPIWLEAIWNWLREGMVTERETFTITTESNSTTIRNVGLVIGGIVAILLAVWRSRVAERQADAAQEQARVAQQQADLAQRGLLNERYQRGAEMLGSGILAARLGGIYALQRLAEEHPERYYIQILSLLCAFARYPTKDEALDEMDDEQEDSVWGRRLRTDVQEVLNIISSRDFRLASLEEKAGFRIDLSNADLRHGFLRNAHLPNANFSSAKLDHASFDGSYLSRAYFDQANLSHAELSDAELSRASFFEAILVDTLLFHANLRGAFLRRADLSGALIMGAKFHNAWLGDANLSGMRPTDDETSLSPEEIPTGLTQDQLDEAVAYPDNPPILDGILDDETDKQLKWCGGVPEEEQA